MECPVCYTNDAKCKLVCGHSFCHECVKNWYIKGGGEGCPMCRQKLYFKGMYKKQEEWDDEYYEKEFETVFSENLDDILSDEHLFSYGVNWGSYLMIAYIKDLEKRFNKLKPFYTVAEDLQWQLDYGDEIIDNISVFYVYDHRTDDVPTYIFKNSSIKKISSFSKKK